MNSVAFSPDGSLVAAGGGGLFEAGTVTQTRDGGEESGAACRAAGGGSMVGARRAGRLGAGAGGRDVLAAGAHVRGLLHRQ